VGRSGESLEAPYWRTISLVASPLASIDTILYCKLTTSEAHTFPLA
ncbi:unnamed protein product, partial [Ascophyllum nodosum]